MAIRRHPEIRFRIDWDDDNYASARADNTAYLERLRIVFGTSAAAE